MTRTLFILTHPPATHHTTFLVGGWHDSLLTHTGHQTAARLASSLRTAIPLSTPLSNIKLFTSDLQRCTQTASYIASTFNIASVSDTRLREKSYGVAEGKPCDEMEKSFVYAPDSLATSAERLDHFDGIAGSETKRAWATRVYAAMNEVVLRGWEVGTEMKNGPGEDEYRIVVTHGGSLTFVIAAWIGMEVESVGWVGFRGEAGTVTVCREEGRWRNRSVERLGVRTEELGMW